MVLGLVKPKRVLELGAGNYSTPLFAEYPTVNRLVSVETDERWLPEIASPNLTIRLVEDTCDALDDLDFDLIFIDNADNATDRERAIRAVLSKEHPVTVIHDAEHPSYNAAIRELSDSFLVVANELPWTAVCW